MVMDISIHLRLKFLRRGGFRPVTVRYMRSREGRDLDIPTGLSEFKSLL